MSQLSCRCSIPRYGVADTPTMSTIPLAEAIEVVRELRDVGATHVRVGDVLEVSFDSASAEPVHGVEDVDPFDAPVGDDGLPEGMTDEDLLFYSAQG